MAKIEHDMPECVSIFLAQLNPLEAEAVYRWLEGHSHNTPCEEMRDHLELTHPGLNAPEPEEEVCPVCLQKVCNPASHSIRGEDGIGSDYRPFQFARR